MPLLALAAESTAWELRTFYGFGPVPRALAVRVRFAALSPEQLYGYGCRGQVAKLEKLVHGTGEERPLASLSMQHMDF
jgi:hypothetical protein